MVDAALAQIGASLSVIAHAAPPIEGDVLVGITQLTHRQSYADIGMVSVIIPIAVTVVGIVLGTMGVV